MVVFLVVRNEPERWRDCAKTRSWRALTAVKIRKLKAATPLKARYRRQHCAGELRDSRHGCEAWSVSIHQHAMDAVERKRHTLNRDRDGIGSDVGWPATRCPNRCKTFAAPSCGHHQSRNSRRRKEDFLREHDENASARRAVKTCRALFRYREGLVSPGGALLVRCHLCQTGTHYQSKEPSRGPVPSDRLKRRPWMAILRPHFWWQGYDARWRPGK